MNDGYWFNQRYDDVKFDKLRNECVHNLHTNRGDAPCDNCLIRGGFIKAK